MKKLLFILLIGLYGYSQSPRVDMLNIDNYYMTQPSITNYEDDVFIASTVSTDFVNRNSEINIVRRSQMGTIIWSKNFYFDSNLFVGSIRVDNIKKELIAVGYVDDFSVKRLFIMVLDLNGNLLRQQVFEDNLFPNMNLYGTDVVITDELGVDDPCSSDARNYIITGFGAANSTHSGNKFAFVASVNGSLTGVNWFKKYDSGVSTTNGNDFDSFNSIREITRNGQKLFLVTGSGVESSTGASMATIDMIDNTGNSLIWGNGRGIFKVVGSYTPYFNDSFGKFAIYNKYIDKIYLIGTIYQNQENSLSIIEIDASTGIPIGHSIISPQTNNIATGVEWLSATQNQFLVSSYNVHHGYCNSQNTKNFTIVDITGSNVSTKAYSFDIFYDETYLQNSLDLDFLINPVNYVYNNNNWYNQAYYTPKGLTNTNFFFESVGINEEAAPLGINNYTLHPINITNDNCNTICLTGYGINNTTQYTNYNGNFGQLRNYEQEIIEKNISINQNAYCNPARPGNTSNESNEEFINNKIKEFVIYPNPGKNYITIKNNSLENDENYQLKIIDINGKVLIDNNIRELNSQVDISSLASGVYIVNILDKNNRTILNEKLIKE